MKNKKYLKAFVSKIAENKYQAIASTDAIDRYGDIVDQKGWQLENYLKNPVMLWAHDSSQLPVAKCTGISRTGGQMVVEFEFAPAEASPLAPYVKASYDQGFLNALSVGFMANERKANVITQSELLEISFVPVPANQEALRLAMTKGLDLGGIEKDLQIEEKGDVADELTAEEVIETKYEKWCEVTEVLSAFYTVFFDETTPVEKFSELLSETIDLLQVVAENDGADDDSDEEKTALIEKKNAHAENLTKFLGGREIKSGKAISGKNAKIIQKAMDHMKLHMDTMTDHMKGHLENYTALEEVLASSSSDEGSGSKGVKEAVPEDVLLINIDDMKILQGQLRATDRQNEVVLSVVNKFFTSKELK